MDESCPCCASNGRLPDLPLIPTPFGTSQMVPGDIVKRMCNDCIGAAFLGAGPHPHPFDDPTAIPQRP